MTEKELYELQLEQLKTKIIEKETLEDRLNQLKRAYQTLDEKKDKLVSDHFISSERIDFIKTFGFVPDSIDDMDKIMDTANRDEIIKGLILFLSMILVIPPLLVPEFKEVFQEVFVQVLGMPFAFTLTVAVPITGLIHHIVSTLKLKKKANKNESTETLEKLTKEYQEQEIEINSIIFEENKIGKFIDLVENTIEKVDASITELNASMKKHQTLVERVMEETRLTQFLYVKEEQEEKPKQYAKIESKI